MSSNPPSMGTQPLTTSSESLSLAGAKLISQAAEAHAAEMKLLHFVRTSNAKLTSINTAIDKAYTAAGHRAPTHVYMENAAFRPGGAAEGIGRTNGGRFVTIGGGIPITNSAGDVIGAIGASGGTPAQDRKIVEAGIEAWELSGKGGKVRAKL
jgi:uncharacterized protein GlcG (DUF336 family)